MFRYLFRGRLRRVLFGLYVHVPRFRDGHFRLGVDRRLEECRRRMRKERSEYDFIDKTDGFYRIHLPGVNNWIVLSVSKKNQIVDTLLINTDEQRSSWDLWM